MTHKELRERQAWPLQQKIDHALYTIESFVARMGGLDKVYISFSGGKDSTVLLHLARILYPDILAVFCNTGNEYPDILRFVREMQSGGGKHTDYPAKVHASAGLGEVWVSFGGERDCGKGT